MDKEIASHHAAYEAFKNSGGKGYNNKPLADWRHLPSDQRQAWRYAADAAARVKNDRAKADRIEHLTVAGYGAYCKAAGGKNYKGDPLPTWQELDQRGRNAYRAMAKEVILSAIGDMISDMHNVETKGH